MNKRTVISATDNTIRKLKVLAKKKKSTKRKLVVTVEKLPFKVKKLAVTSDANNLYKSKRTVISVKDNTILKLKVPVDKSEGVRSKLAVKAGKLRVLAKKKERVRTRLAVTAKRLAATAKEKESVRTRLVVTAKELAVVANEKEGIRLRLAVTADKLRLLAKEKEDIRRRLAVTAKRLVATAKEKESVRRNLIVTAKEKERVRNKLAVTAKRLAATAKEKESIKNRLVVTAKRLAVTAKEKESVRLKLAVTAEELSEAKSQDEAILFSIGDAVMACNKAGIVVLFNTVAEKLSGYLMAKVIGRHYSQTLKFVQEGDWKRSTDFIAEVIVTGKPVKMASHTLLITKDGRKIPVANSAAPVRNAEGKIIGCVVVFRDVSKEREVDRAKSEFVSLASHQLRTPPTSMRWFLEMLLSGEIGQLNEKQKEYFDEVYKNNKRMITLVNTLLNVSRIELGVLAIEPEPTDIIALTKGIIEEFNPQIHEKDLHMNEKYPKNLKAISVDPKLIRIAIQDVISNAVKYTPPRGTVGVEIFLKKSGEGVGGRTIKKDSLIVVVSDTGYGIPERQQDKIFTKLFRADNVKEKDTEGTGLGLYLAKSIIDHAQGDIWFKSELNNGSVFYLVIPLGGMEKRKGTVNLTDGSTG